METEIEEQLATNLMEKGELWVFGYGSLLWKPGFCYSAHRIGYVEGYARRLWQGNTTHRGTPELPGRVATLVECPDERVWGVAFQLVGSTQIKLCLEHLGVRECKLGGYKTKMLPFITRDNDSSDNVEQIAALTFIAMPENRLFLGPIDLDDMAVGIIASHGESGSNVEYVIRMAEFMHDYIPEEHDEHLFELETKIRLRLYEMSRLDYGDSYQNGPSKMLKPTGRNSTLG